MYNLSKYFFLFLLKVFSYSSITVFWLISLRDTRQIKVILRDFVEIHYIGAFLVVAIINSAFQELQWFGRSVVDLVPKKRKKNIAMGVVLVSKILTSYPSAPPWVKASYVWWFSTKK